LPRLTDRTAIVTGGASGIGRAVARVLAREGAAVVVADIQMGAAESVVSEIREAGGRAIATCTDVSDEDAIREMVDAAIDAFGRLDVLHNNASDLRLLQSDLDVVGMDVGLWDRTLAISLRGPMLGCKHAIPRMLEQGGGSIVNTSSINGRRGDVTRTAYGAAKGGLNTLTQYVATTYGGRGIRCNAICPGVIRTRPGMTGDDPGLRPMLNSTTAGRFGEPEEVAELVLFLASPESAFVTGQIIEIDGGLLSRMPYTAEYAALGRRPGERSAR
jgi:NAD(P)-dependent dehydrogenase (short-subunit alcohol dehydrogenase family)